MTRVGVATALLMLGACTDRGSHEAGNSIDVEQAAAQAQANIDRYAAVEGQPTPVPAAAPHPVSSPAVTSARRPAARLTTAEPAGVKRGDTVPGDGRSAADARALVERYFALIAAGRYDEARATWGDGGAGSGLEPRAFAASFRRFSRYRPRSANRSTRTPAQARSSSPCPFALRAPCAKVASLSGRRAQ